MGSIVALWGIVFAAWAQEFRGSLSGKVRDQQKAVVPGAKIIATETETGAKFQTVSNSDGTYVLPSLPPGPYSITAEAPGFKKRLRTYERKI